MTRGLARKARRLPTRLRIDEKAIRKGHHYETVIVDLDTETVEAVLDERTQASLEAYYPQFTAEELATVEAIAMDMWEPYIRATHACVPGAATKIVFDKYHAVRTVTGTVDEIRRVEHKALQTEKDDRLTGTKYLWLCNAENIPSWRRAEFEGLKAATLKTSRAWAIKEALRGFRDYTYPKCAAKYFAAWYSWATHSRLAPMIKAAKTPRRHLPNLLTYITHGITNATSEGSQQQDPDLQAHGLRVPESGALQDGDSLPLRGAGRRVPSCDHLSEYSLA